MITIQPITPQNALLFKTIRLRALQDAPGAFGSTYAKESGFADEEWVKRAQRWSGEFGIGYLAMDGQSGCGIAGSFLDENDATRAHLISMWTDPAYRRKGVGRLLVDEITRWARQRSAITLVLLVTSKNDAAISFYKRLGFAMTGRTEPYPNDPAMIEFEMTRPIP